MTISDRLQQIVDSLNITPNAFALNIGVSQPRFSNYLKGRAPDFETLNRICTTYVRINERWLLTGEGEMLKDSEVNTTNEVTKDDTETNSYLVKELLDALKRRDEEIKVLRNEKKAPAPLEGNAADADVS